jgi:hypothetical protein
MWEGGPLEPARSYPSPSVDSGAPVLRCSGLPPSTVGAGHCGHTQPLIRQIPRPVHELHDEHRQPVLEAEREDDH